MSDPIEKVSIIISKDHSRASIRDSSWPTEPRAEGIEANLFFTFFGMEAILKKRQSHIKVATVGNPGLHMASVVGALRYVALART